MYVLVLEDEVLIDTDPEDFASFSTINTTILGVSESKETLENLILKLNKDTEDYFNKLKNIHKSKMKQKEKKELFENLDEDYPLLKEYDLIKNPLDCCNQLVIKETKVI